MRLHKSIKAESKKRQLINKAKRELSNEYTKIVGYAFFPEDMGLTEIQVLKWYKTHLKLEEIRNKHIKN